MTNFPPFDALIAFESVMRTGSMTAAGEDLGITQSAVSHRIRRLEDYFGVPLMNRSATGLTVTSAGRALEHGLGDILVASRDLRARCRRAAAPDILKVGVGSALANNWLVRRLPDFRDRYPEVQIELSVLENEDPESKRDLDVRIVWAAVSEARRSTVQMPLFREHVFPVASPELLKGTGLPLASDALAKLPLLHKRVPGQSPVAEWSWEHWFLRLGLTGMPDEALRFSSIGPLVAAAVNGAGVALVRTMVARDALKAGSLVRLLAPEDDMLSGKMHVVRWSGSLVGDQRVQDFAAWISHQASQVDDA